jgi:hypothetical protein
MEGIWCNHETPESTVVQDDEFAMLSRTERAQLLVGAQTSNLVMSARD